MEENLPISGGMQNIQPLIPGQIAQTEQEIKTEIQNQGDLTAQAQGLSEMATREKNRIAQRLQGFNPKDNQAWYQITQKFGTNIKQPELLSIAQVCSSSAGIKLDRDAKRRKSVLIKWFEENWAHIQPFLNYVVLEDTSKPPMPMQQMIPVQPGQLIPQPNQM